ncbi:hypothetical protein D4764_04G0011680, partial [Takifugu flavidus]
MSLKGKFTQSLEEIDCEPSQKEIIGTLPKKDRINFSEELLCLASNRKSTEGEANKAKHTESQVEEESESSQKEISDTKSTESPVEYIESSQQESSEDSTRDTSCVDTSVDNATSLYLQLLLTWLVSGWSRGFVIGFSPGLSADATLQNLLRQDDHRVSARMGIPYFSVVEHFPLHPEKIGPETYVSKVPILTHL